MARRKKSPSTGLVRWVRQVSSSMNKNRCSYQNHSYFVAAQPVAVSWHLSQKANNRYFTHRRIGCLDSLGILGQTIKKTSTPAIAKRNTGFQVTAAQNFLPVLRAHKPPSLHSSSGGQFEQQSCNDYSAFLGATSCNGLASISPASLRQSI